MCDIANVSKSGYYKWLNNKNKISVQEILEVIYIKEIFSRKDRVYGIRTIKMKLEQDYGIVINRKKIARIMKENNLITKTRKQKPYSKQKVNQEQLISENIVIRNFKDRTALEAFGIDITYLSPPFGERTNISNYSRNSNTKPTLPNNLFIRSDKMSC